MTKWETVNPNLFWKWENIQINIRTTFEYEASRTWIEILFFHEKVKRKMPYYSFQYSVILITFKNNENQQIYKFVKNLTVHWFIEYSTWKHMLSVQCYFLHVKQHYIWVRYQSNLLFLVKKLQNFGKLHQNGSWNFHDIFWFRRIWYISFIIFKYKLVYLR